MCVIVTRIPSEVEMLNKILELPFRIVRRVANLMDGERSAPAHTPAVATLINPDLLGPAKTEAPEAKEKTSSPKRKKAPAAKKKAAAPPASVQITPEPTPNPNAMKFSVGQTVCSTGSFSFSVGEAEVAHPIAQAVLAVEGVKTVFGVNDFVTVTKQDDVAWDELVPHLVGVIGGALAAEN